MARLNSILVSGDTLVSGTMLGEEQYENGSAILRTTYITTASSIQWYKIGRICIINIKLVPAAASVAAGTVVATGLPPALTTVYNGIAAQDSATYANVKHINVSINSNGELSFITPSSLATTYYGQLIYMALY